jgi:hypothetical protein
MVGATRREKNKKALRRSRSTLFLRQLICPSGSCREFVSSAAAKNKSLRDLLKSDLLIPASRLNERGVSRSSRTWSAGCGGRGSDARRAALIRLR